MIAALGYILAAFAVGLWLGERGRRRAAERLATYGNPEEGRTRPPTSVVPTNETRERVEAYARTVSDETERRVADFILTEARVRAQAGESEFEGYTPERAAAEAAALIGDYIAADGAS